MVHSKVLETPNQPDGTGVWTFYGKSVINVPAAVAWAAVCDLNKYGEWNEYNTSMVNTTSSTVIHVDDMITCAYRPEPQGKTMDVPMKVLVVNNEEMILSWRGMAMGIPTWIFLPEKVQKIVALGEDQCQYEVYETQSGPMAYMVKWTMGEKLGEMSRGMANGLKEYLEKVKSTGGR